MIAMRAEHLQVELYPRSPWEAMELGGVMGVYISINTLCDMGATCVNVIGDMAGCVVLQEKIKLEEN